MYLILFLNQIKKINHFSNFIVGLTHFFLGFCIQQTKDKLNFIIFQTKNMNQFALFQFFNLFPYQNQPYNMWGLQNSSSLVQTGFNFTQYPDKYYNSIHTSYSQVEGNVCGGNDSTKTIDKQQNIELESQNEGQLSDHLKEKQFVDQVQKVKKHKNNDFAYYDPGQAPNLTFRIGDIELRQMKSHKQIKTENIQKIDENIQKIDIELPDNEQNQIFKAQNSQKLWQFHITEPDPYFLPFLIIKAKPSKRRLLSVEQYQRRAEQIEKRRIKNVHRLQTEQRIGKKLPTKNKKWQRKKPSLVFNANKYKKKLMNSKKFKSSQVKFKELFTGAK